MTPPDPPVRPIPSVPSEPALVSALANMVPPSVATAVAKGPVDDLFDATFNLADFVDSPAVVDAVTFEHVETLLEPSPVWPDSSAELLALLQEPSRVFSELGQQYGVQRIPERTIATTRALARLTRFCVSLAWLTRSLREQLDDAVDGWAEERANATGAGRRSEVENDLARQLKEAVEHGQLLQAHLDAALTANADNELKLKATAERETTLETRLATLEDESRRHLGEPAAVATFLLTHLPSAQFCDGNALVAALDACRQQEPASLASIVLMANFMRRDPASALYPAPTAPPGPPGPPAPAPPTRPAPPPSGDSATSTESAASARPTVTTSAPTSGPSGSATGDSAVSALNTLVSAAVGVGDAGAASTPPGGAAEGEVARSSTSADSSTSEEHANPEDEEKTGSCGDDVEFGTPESDHDASSESEPGWIEETLDDEPSKTTSLPHTRPPASTPSPKRIRLAPFVFLHVPRPVAPGVTLHELTITLHAGMSLSERYAELRKDAAYTKAVPVAAKAALRREDAYQVHPIPTDLAFAEDATMGSSWELGTAGIQRKKMNQWSLQVEGSGNTPGYPNYGVIHNDSRDVVASYGPCGVQHYLAFLETRPWDTMWESRVTRTYLLDIRLLSGESVRWVQKTLLFGYAFRQALWDRYFWLHCQRVANLAITSWIPVATRRERLEKHLVAAWDQLVKEMPTTMRPYAPLWEAEPAFWFCPQMHCNWVPPQNLFPATPPEDGAVPLLGRLVRDLACEEPVRAQWASPHTERFVDALPHRLQRLLALHHSIGISFSLPPPWDDPDFVPWHPDGRSLGSPGPDFISPDFDQATFTEWCSLAASLKQAARLFEAHPPTRPSRGSVPSPLDGIHLREWIPRAELTEVVVEEEEESD